MKDEVVKSTPLYMNEPKMALDFLVEKLGFAVVDDATLANRDEVTVYDGYGNSYEVFLTGRNKPNTKTEVNVIINTTDCLQDFYKIGPTGVSIISKPHYAPEGLAFEILDYWNNKYTFLEKRDYND
jgi:hypothetical protein